MKYECGAHTKTLGIPLMILATIVLLMLLSQVMGTARSSRGARGRKVPVPGVQKERIASRIASNYGGGPFQASLEMKESADFLLTPAILVQEAICDDIVNTYPTE
ncbi:MAG: hypothetical protein JRI22_22290 [Deltaproteobacteria bacterium]|nr:hypothetical protein [Deltaproteobacteria bacterium]